MSVGIRIRVLVADDHPAVRAGIAAMIANEPDMALVGEAADGAEAAALYDTLRPDVVLMDLRMPRVDGITSTRAIRATDPTARVIALTTYDGDAAIERARDAGASACLIKDTMIDQLVVTIRSLVSRHE